MPKRNYKSSHQHEISPEIVGIVVFPEPLYEEVWLPKSKETLGRSHRLPRPLESICRLLFHCGRRRHRRPWRRLFPHKTICGRRRHRRRCRETRKSRHPPEWRIGVAALAPIQLLVAVRALRRRRRGARRRRWRWGWRRRCCCCGSSDPLVLLVLHHLDTLDGCLVELREGRCAKLKRCPKVALLLR